MNDDRTLVQDLVSDVSELEPLLRSHLAFHQQLLPHVFMGDVTRFVVTTCQAFDREDASAFAARSLVKRIISILEDALATRTATKELIADSFVENLWGEETTVRALRPFLGPALTAEMKAQGLIKTGPLGK